MNINWQAKKLGEIIKLEYGKPLSDTKRNPEGAYPVYGANGEKSRTDEYFYNQQSIIIGRKGSAGEINLTEEKFWPLDVTYFVTFDHEKYSLQFLFYLLSNLELPKLAKGVKPGINRNEVYSILVKIPLLTEQKRIVAILAKTFATIDKAKSNVEQNLKNAKELFDNYLQEIFNPNKKGWTEEQMNALFKIKHGFAFKGKYFTTDFEGNDPIVLTPGNYSEEGGLYFKEKNTKRYHSKYLPEFLFQKGDLTIVMTDLSSKMKILGKPAIIEFDNILHNQRIGKFEFLSNKIDKLFLYYFLMSNKFLEHIKSTSTGTMVKHTAPGRILSTLISYPLSINQQKEIVQSIMKFHEELGKVKNIYQLKLKHLDHLKKTILQKAFSGELTTENIDIDSQVQV